ASHIRRDSPACALLFSGLDLASVFRTGGGELPSTVGVSLGLIRSVRKKFQRSNRYQPISTGIN
ncbi:MAG: hypothetical protein WA858_24245, partial [Xanthobacteraceae bacterium]